MSLPNDRSRINSLRVTRKWIYQLWVLELLCDAVQVYKFKGHEYGGKPCLWIEQGSDLSTSIGKTAFGDITFWLEFQSGKAAHMAGMFVGKRVPVRPDLVAVKGYFETTKDFVDSKKSMDLIIECKEDSFDKWKNEIQSQIFRYQETFKPNNFIIISLEHVPDITRSYLEPRGIKVVDYLKPNSENIRTLYDTIRRGFK